MRKGKSKLVSIMSILLCVVMVASNVYAYPISKNTYQMTTSSAEDLTDMETIVWESEDPDHDHAYSPAICVTESGRIIVSYDISAKRGEVKYSDDGGVTWVQATTQDDAFIFARPFEAKSGLYLIARRYATDTASGNGQLIMFKSTDNGETWGTASVIDAGVWHSAPSEVVHLNGYVYMTWEAQDTTAAQAAGGAGRGILAPVILRAKETEDLTVASNWIITDSADTYLSYWDAVGGNSFSVMDYMGVPFMRYRYGESGIRNLGWLEGNIVRITDPGHVLYDENAFYIYLRSSADTSDYANLMKVTENGDGTMHAELVTTPSGKTNLYVQLPGGQSKFYITYDEQDEMYWLASNVSTDSMEVDTTWGEGADTSRHEGPQDIRNELGLYYSANAMDWNFAGMVSATDDIGQARCYPSMVIHGNDLLVVSRSGDENAESGHNTNLITFHKIKNFRNLVNQDEISEGTQSLIYAPEVLNDSSVTDIHTHITATGRSLVTCSISDETSTTSKVLLEQSDGTYLETLSTGYKLGEPFGVDGTTYVFGVANYKLIAFSSSDNGATWSGPAVIDATRDWYDAPTSVIVNDDTVMLALSEITKGNYVPLRGYNTEATGSVTYDEATSTADFHGYGAVAYTEAFYLEEGDFLTFHVTPTALVSGNNNDFGLAFLNAPTFFGNADTDYADGFAMNLKTNGDYTDGYFHAYTSYVSAGSAPNITTNTERIGAKGLQGGLLNNDIEVKFTKKTQTVSGVDYAWEITFTYTNESGERATLTKNVPASQVPADTFDNGLWFAAGGRSGAIVQYKVFGLGKNLVEEAAPEWMAYDGGGNYKAGTVIGVDENVTLTTTSSTARAAGYYTKKIVVEDGTQISFDIDYPTLVAGSPIQYAFGLSTGLNSFYSIDSVATNTSLVAEFYTANPTLALTVGYGYRLPSGSRVAGAKSNISVAGTDISDTTYHVTLTKLASESDDSWSIAVAEKKTGGTELSWTISDDFVTDDAYANGAYVIAGTMNGTNNTATLTNLIVEKVSTEEIGTWTRYEEGGNYKAGTVTQSGKDVMLTTTSATARAAAYYDQKIAVEDGTQISFDIDYPTLVAGSAIQYAFGLSTGLNSFYSIDSVATNTSLVAEFYTANPTSALTVGYGYRLPSGSRVAGAKANISVAGTDISNTTYHVTLTKLASESDDSWSVAVVEKKTGGTELSWTISDDYITDDAYANGAYVIAGTMNGINNTATLTNLTVTKLGDESSTPDSEGDILTKGDVYSTYLVSPVIMTASVSSVLTSEASWTYYDGGQSFMNKFGNAYSNTKLQFFGLPYADKDIRTIGWSNLKLFEVHETDDIRHDNQLNAGETTGNIYGYMTLENVGYDYAAFVKINTSTEEIEYFTPAGLDETYTEEEMTLSKLPGGNNGFELIYDESSGLYWLVTVENIDSTSISNAYSSRVAVYYGTNAYDWRSAGVVAQVSEDAQISAQINGSDMVITVFDGNVMQYKVPNFGELAKKSKLGDWSKIESVYGGSSAYTVTEKDNLITLTNFGAATCNQKIDVTEGTQISLTVKGTSIDANNVFAVGLVDTHGSFPSKKSDGTTFNGDGLVASVKANSSLVGGVVRYASMENAKTNTSNTFSTENGNAISGVAMTDNEITFTFTKKSQTISDVAYSWEVKWVESIGNTTGSYRMPATDVPDSLFTDGAYIFAGCRFQGNVTYEISNITVTQPVLGDINADGEINVLDITAADYKYRAVGGEQSGYATYEKAIYDINEDGNCNTLDITALREQVLKHRLASAARVTEDAEKGNVRLERKHYQLDGVDMIDITINTDFVCGGFEGIFIYDEQELTYKGMHSKIDNRNAVEYSINDGDKGLMVLALGTAKYGTQGKIITLTFEGTSTDSFNIQHAVFADAAGSVQIDTSIYDVMLGDANEDFEINSRDLVRLKMQVKNGAYVMNSDCDRDNATTDLDDCKLLREYLCEKIAEF